MSEDSSVTLWLNGLKAGDAESVRKLWERYFPRLVRLAASRVPFAARRVFDEEDVALSAFRDFLTNVEQGSFPQLDHRDNLWPILVVITSRKARTYVRDQNRQKRGGGHVVAASELASEEDTAFAGMDQFLARDPTPEFAAQLAEEWDRLLGLLQDVSLQTIAVLKMQGYTVAEIATKLQTAHRTVERRLQIIRKKWDRELTDEG